MTNRAKLPVFNTIVEALKYPATHFFQVLKVSFLPTLVIYGPITLLAIWAFDTLWPEIISSYEMASQYDEDGDFQSAVARRNWSTGNGLMNLIQLAGLLFTAMVTVPLTRAIVRNETPGFFRLDRDVWWYALGQIVFGLAIAGIMLGLLALFGGLAAVMMEVVESQPAAIAVGLVGGLVLFFVLLRLSLFLPEVAMTGKFGFRASYSMTKGNVWRIIGLGLIMMICLMMLYIFVGGILLGVAALLFGGSVAEIASSSADGDPQAILAWLKDTIMSPAGGIMGALLLIVSIYATGFSIALPAFMYKALEANRKEPS